MDTALAAFNELEVFDRVSDVDVLTIDASLNESAVEDAAGGSDEGFAGAVFDVSRLFADEHDARVSGPFTENSLRCELIQMASFAFSRRGCHYGEAVIRGNERGCGTGRDPRHNAVKDAI
jgi:hypothetical protein